MTTFTTYATATFTDGNIVTVVSAENMFSGLPITFSGNTFGNITPNATYYIGNITYGYPTSNITLTSLPGGGIYALANGSGNMVATFSQGGQQIIPTVPPGEPLNQAFDAINVNFDQIWAAGPVGSNIQIVKNTILTLNTNGDLVLNPNGIGNVVANAHVVPDRDRVRNLGAPALRWNNIYAQQIVGNISGNVAAGGSNTQVQFNNAGLLAGANGFTYNNSTQAVSVTGTITSGNVLTPGIVSSAGGMYGDVYTTMIDSGDSSAIFIVSDVNTLSDFSVGQSLDVGGQISAVGNITGNYYFGNGSQLTGITADNVNADDLIGNTLSGNVLFSSLTTVGDLVSLSVVGTATVGDLDSTGTVCATGNVSGGNILFGSGIVSGTGNIYANKIFANIQGNIDAAGNLYEIQFNTTGDQLGASPAFTFNNTSNLLYVGGNISASGNVTVGQDLSVVGNIYGNVLANIPASSRIFYVAKNGSDSNDGTINRPFATIKHAMSVATAGTSVHVAPGNYTELNPITIPPNVALIGDNLRSVSITPQTPADDLFYMTNGTYVWGITIRSYLANGFSYDPATPTQNVFISPYIQNITSFTTTGTAVKIDGNLTSSNSTKAMIVGFFTIINRGGRGIYILNSGYSQLVNIYTIACDIGILVESGGFCTLNGSDCSIGNYGLIANGVGSLQTTGSTIGYSTQGLFTVGSLSNGRPWVNTVMKIPGDPTYYTIDDIVPINATTSEIYVQQTYTGNLAPGTSVEFFVRSSIIASAHTFEYVGAGTDPSTALPQYGGIPIEANEVLQLNGGVVTFTSTDQKGNFKVGQGFTINQAQGTITGTYFYKSLFAQMTPYILAITPD